MIVAGARSAPPIDLRDDDAVAHRVDSVEGPDGQAFLIELMDERHPVYRGRGTTRTIQIRGYAMAAFARVGLPDRALMFLIEELESGVDAFLVAAAARGLRGLDGPERRVVPFLLRALCNIRDRDELLTFATYKPTWPVVGETTTALAEILRTLALLGPHAAFALPQLVELEAGSVGMPAVTRDALQEAIRSVQADPGVLTEADCCRGGEPITPRPDTRRTPRTGQPPFRTRFEDQAGAPVTYGEAFIGAPSVVVFFYTRCTNPNKCSLTITKLARLQQAIGAAGLAGRIRTAGITYDPAFDLPPRLRSYGENRGMRFGPDDRLLRTTTALGPVEGYFDLGVGFGAATVNRHRIEAFVVGPDGRLGASFSRLQWDVTEVRDAAIRLIRQPHPSHGGPT